jgi:ATP-dependent DNA ligase
MALPFDPPIEPMLAKAIEGMPVGDWVYEPKWDGFRAIVFKDGNDVTIFSRDLKPLNRYFPEVEESLRAELPKACVLDGEIVVPSKEGLDFDALLQRIHPAASRVKRLAEETPSSFVAFDLLAEGRKDLREKRLDDRRARLEEVLAGAVHLPGDSPAEDQGDLEDRVIEALMPSPVVAITPQTSDPKVAEFWFEVFEGAGLDGVIAKKTDQIYVPGGRVMLKIKHHRTADCVVGGYRMNKTNDGIGSLLLGLYDNDGVLHYVGHTSSFKAPERRQLLKDLKKYEGGESFGGGRTPGGPSRWTGMTGRDTGFVPLKPELVCEVRYEHLQSGRFRHAARFQRWRPDKPPEECTFDQILPRGRTKP